MKRSTIIILLIALALGGFVYYEMKSGKERDADEKTSKPAFTFKSEDIASVNLMNKGQIVAVERSDKDWTITQPVKTAAEASAIESLVSSIAEATIDRSLAITDGLKKGAGLVQPNLSLDFKLKNGEQHKILLGVKDPTEANVYAQIDQNPNVVLLPVALLTNADKKLSDLRSKEILKISQDELSSVKITNQTATLVAEKNAEAKWLIKEPANQKDKEVTASKFLSALSTPAAEIIDTPDDKVKAAIAKSVVTAELMSKDKPAIKLYLSLADKDNVYARVEGKNEIYKAPKALLEAFNFKIADVITAPSPVTDEQKTEKPEIKPDEKK